RARRARRLNGAADVAHSLWVEFARPTRAAERAAKNQVVGPERRQRRNVLEPQCPREPAHQSGCARVAYERREIRITDVIAQRAAPLVRGVEHDSGGAGVEAFE